jgi:hypothetical protein
LQHNLVRKYVIFANKSDQMLWLVISAIVGGFFLLLSTCAAFASHGKFTLVNKINVHLGYQPLQTFAE